MSVLSRGRTNREDVKGEAFRNEGSDLTCDCLLQRRTEEFGSYSPVSCDDGEKLIYWKRAKNVQEQWPNIILFLDSWQGNLA